MSISKLQGFYGFTRMPFGRDLAPGMLHRHAGHGEAAARITWAVISPAVRRRCPARGGGIGAGQLAWPHCEADGKHRRSVDVDHLFRWRADPSVEASSRYEISRAAGSRPVTRSV